MWDKNTHEWWILGIQTVDVGTHISMATIKKLGFFEAFLEFIFPIMFYVAMYKWTIYKKKKWEGNLLGPFLHTYHLSMTNHISRGVNHACGPPWPSI